VEAGAGTDLRRRVALGALVLVLVGIASALIVTGAFESSRADRVERATARTNAGTRQSRAQVVAIDRQVRSAQEAEQRLEADEQVVQEIDIAPMTSYSAIVRAMDDLSTAMRDLVQHNTPGDPGGRLAQLLLDARTELAAFQKDLLVYETRRSAVRSDVKTARGR
jgi:type II secretory pathway pseudopilin PulG